MSAVVASKDHRFTPKESFPALRLGRYGTNNTLGQYRAVDFEYKLGRPPSERHHSISLVSTAGAALARQAINVTAMSEAANRMRFGHMIALDPNQHQPPTGIPVTASGLATAALTRPKAIASGDKRYDCRTSPFPAFL
jgi:hypothetical protein